MNDEEQDRNVRRDHMPSVYDSGRSEYSYMGIHCTWTDRTTHRWDDGNHVWVPVNEYDREERLIN